MAGLWFSSRFLPHLKCYTDADAASIAQVGNKHSPECSFVDHLQKKS